MAPVTIHVEGQSTISRLAERAAMSVDISSEGPAQDTVSTAVTATARKLQSELDELRPLTEGGGGEVSPDAPISFYALEALSTWSRADTDREGKATGGRTYGARTHFDITFRDFARLGAMTDMLAKMPLVSVKGVTWTLTEGTEKLLAVQSRREALEDAVQRARDFADVVGCKTVECVEIRQGGGHAAIGMQRPMPMGRSMVAGASGPAGAGVGGGLEFVPQKVMKSASVSVQFLAS
ncbi:hypothetical protein FIBSPDRAFT_855442 [Athelia psychrophila]|uniref:SIMPL domain-containing protein n=1 Tax=Athelia psychrophila TaxID=1759441 RepID=A0A166P7W4_9AGAM|nr:hypothetical protein FIBSPDRAFT_855442 [Fibularhizoctonia sp. CBS 109695]